MSHPFAYYPGYSELPSGACASFASQYCSPEFCSRLRTAYLAGDRDYQASLPAAVTGHWDEGVVGNVRRDIEIILKHEKDEDSIRFLLSNPLKHNLLYGFDNVAASLAKYPLDFNSLYGYDVLRRLAEAMGLRAHQVERNCAPEFIPVDALLTFIERQLGSQLLFPAPYPGMTGIADKRGIIRHRALWGLYLAWRAKQMKAESILEIGGGLGYAAYYASLLGVKEYTIVDLPLTLVASGHYLGLTRGEDNVTLYGEKQAGNAGTPDGSTAIHLLPPHTFPVGKRFDAVVNMDSFVEFGIAAAKDYIAKIKAVSRKFISINHEGFPYTVRELLINDPAVANYTRYPFWLRKGYVEEIFEFN